MECPEQNILVAMSGGVDSSVAALILKNEGYHVKGIIFRLHNTGMTPEDLSNGKLPQSIWYAREAARRMHLEFSIVDVRDRFCEEVINYFLAGVGAGEYPDPCIHCCHSFLLPELLQEADAQNCPKIATGHYAIVEYDPRRERYVIRKSRDTHRDQSQHLYRLSQGQLSRLVMPLGSFEKEQIRALAEEARLKNAKAPESPEICFIENRQYKAFVEGKIPSEFLKYAVDPVTEPSFRRKHIRVDRVFFSGIDDIPEQGIRLTARIRHPGNDAECFVRPQGAGILDIELDQALAGAAPGHSVVLYEGDVVAAGGTIICEE